MHLATRDTWRQRYADLTRVDGEMMPTACGIVWFATASARDVTCEKCRAIAAEETIKALTPPAPRKGLGFSVEGATTGQLSMSKIQPQQAPVAVPLPMVQEIQRRLRNPKADYDEIVRTYMMPDFAHVEARVIQQALSTWEKPSDG